MRTFAHFDSQGTIKSIVVVDAPNGVNAGLVPEAGLDVAEVEGLEIDLAAEGEAIRGALDGYKIEPASPSPRRVVKK
jgi:hypothetical protein